MLYHGIYDKKNLYKTVEGILYRTRVGCPWRDLPSEFGDWRAVYKRFNEWSKKGILMSIFNSLAIDPDTEWVCIDGSYIKAHQHSAGAPGKEDQAIGKSRAGNTTKVHLVVDACGFPIFFTITGGDVNDCSAAPTLIEGMPEAGMLLADKGYDSEKIRQLTEKKGITPMIPRRSKSLIGNKNMDWGMYKYRHLVENAFAHLKRFRAIATRYDKLKRNYESSLALMCAFLWLPM